MIAAIEDDDDDDGDGATGDDDGDGATGDGATGYDDDDDDGEWWRCSRTTVRLFQSSFIRMSCMRSRVQKLG